MVGGGGWEFLKINIFVAKKMGNSPHFWVGLVTVEQTVKYMG